MDVLQPLARNMCVDLRSGYVRVPEHNLNGTQIGPSFQQMRRKGMPEGVGMDSLVEARSKHIPFYYFPETLTCKPFTRSIQKEDVRF